MANPKIKFKRSSVASKRPTLNNLELGELALNTYDGKLFTVQDTGGVGIATTVTLINPWIESYGGGTITYNGSATIGQQLTVNNIQATGVTTSFGGFILRDPSDISFDSTAYTFDSTAYTFDSSPISAGIYADGSASFTGIVTASQFVGDGSLMSGLVTSITAGDNISIDQSTGNVTITGLANTAHVSAETLTVSGVSTFSDDVILQSNLNVTGVSTFTGDANFQNVSVGGTLSLSGAGSQFFAFNEDTVKVKFANWYSSNDRQYGMGQLWFETWFAAIDNNPSPSLRNERRIGFYLDQPNNGSSDSGGTSNIHPTNDRMHIDINGVFVRDNFEVTGVSTFTGDITANGNIVGDDSTNISGINSVTATSFDGDLTGNATGLSGTPNIAVGVLTASSLTYPTTDGSPNQVIVTDGAGNLSFADQTGGGSGGPGVTTTNSTAEVGIDTFAKATYSTGLYNIQAQRGSEVELTTLNVVHNGTLSYVTQYGVLSTGPGIATYTTKVDGSEITLYTYPSTSDTTTFTINRTLIGTGVAGITSTTTTSTTETPISTFNKGTYKAVMFEVQALRGTSVHSTTIHLVHNGTTTYTSEFGTLRTGPSLASYDADISGSDVRLLATPTSATQTTFNVKRTFFT